MRKKLQIIHSVKITEFCSLQKCRQINFLTKEIMCKLISRFFFSSESTVHTVHTVKFTLTEIFFRQINYLVISLVNRYFHEFFAKNV